MAVDPYVPVNAADAPRRSVTIPPAHRWTADRPGDMVPGSGDLRGDPGPDSGYALTLATAFRDRLDVAYPETAHDAEVVGAELAMRRGSIFGRAPIMADLELAFTLFGWLGGAPPELVEWRRFAVADIGHAYPRRRALVNDVPEASLRIRPEEARSQLSRWRGLLGVPG